MYLTEATFKGTIFMNQQGIYVKRYTYPHYVYTTHPYLSHFYSYDVNSKEMNV